MSNLTSRPYTVAVDLPRMVSLCHSLRQKGQVIYPIAADLYEELADPAVQATVRLWQDHSEQLVGFAYVNRYQNLVGVFDAARLSPHIGWEIIARGGSGGPQQARGNQVEISEELAARRPAATSERR